MARYCLIFFFFSLFYLWLGRCFPIMTVKYAVDTTVWQKKDDYYKLVKLPVLLGR